MLTGGGLLRERVQFQRRGAADDEAGTLVGAWANVGIPVSARIKPLTGSEALQAGRLAGSVAYEITVRGSTVTRTIDAECRAVNVRTGATYNVAAVVNPDEAGAYLIVTATSGGADG